MLVAAAWLAALAAINAYYLKVSALLTAFFVVDAVLSALTAGAALVFHRHGERPGGATKVAD